MCRVSGMYRGCPECTGCPERTVCPEHTVCPECAGGVLNVQEVS